MTDEHRKMVRILDEDTIAVSLPNRLGHERVAMESSASFARIVGFQKDRIEDLKTVVSEACLNAMEHGNQGRPDARVVVTMRFRNNVFTVWVRDEGAGIAEVPGRPDLDRKMDTQEAPRGLGIFLIRSLTDQVEFNQVTSEGHEVRMELKLAD